MSSTEKDDCKPRVDPDPTGRKRGLKKWLSKPAATPSRDLNIQGNWHRSDAFREDLVRKQDEHQPQDARNVDSYGFVTARPGITIRSSNDETEPEALVMVKPDITSSEYTGLNSIRNCILRAYSEFPELNDQKHDSAEDAVLRLVEHYKLLSAPLRDSRGRLDTADKMRDDLYNAQKGLHNAYMQLSISRENFADLQRRHHQEIDQLRCTIDIIKDEKAELMALHDSNMRKEQDAFQREKDQLQTKSDVELREMLKDSDLQATTIKDLRMQLDRERTHWNATVGHLKRDKAMLETRLGTAQYEHYNHIKAVEEKHKELLSQEKATCEEMITSLESDIAQLKSKTQEEVLTKRLQARLLAIMDDEDAWREFSDKDLLLKAFKAYRCDMSDSDSSTGEPTPPGTPTNQNSVEQYAQESLQALIKDYKAGLTQRDHSKCLTDRDVAGHFMQLALAVDDFSRLKWDHRKERDWPLTEYQLRLFNPKNVSKLKHRIIQDNLWVKLYDCVFRTPFQIFGDQGQHIDADWIKIYSTDVSPSEWPSVTERRRYETARAFLAATEPSAPPEKLKQGYEQSVTAAVDAMCRELEQVATIGREKIVFLERILRLAATVWLEICSQRYRLMVVLPKGSYHTLVKRHEFALDLGNIRRIKLVVRPQLVRYGDSQGRDLTRREAVTGWDGLTEIYPSE